MCLGKLLGKCRVQRFYQEKPLGLRYHLYAVDVSSRSFTFNKNNYSYKTAYFNVGAVGRALQYTINLTLPGEKEPHTYFERFDFGASHSYHLTVKLDDESKSKISIGIMVDGTLVDEKTATEIINPYE